MSTLNLIASVALLVACYFSTLHRALVGLRPSALHRRLSERGREHAAQWLMDHTDAALLASGLLWTVTRLTFFCLVLWGVAAADPERRLTVSALLIAGGISAGLLWLAGTVLGSAISRHAGTGVVVRSMPLLWALIIVGIPLRRLLAFVDESVRRLSGANLENGEEADAELLRSIEDSQRVGALDAEAAELLENVVEFRSTDVGEVMTPRLDIEGIQLTDDLAAIRDFIQESGHSRIPVYQDSLDRITGILYVKDLVPFLGRDAADFQLKPLLRQPIRVPPTKPVQDLLADFQQAEVHMALVIDEYGGTAGLVTIEDVLEELVGEIHDEHEPEDETLPAFTPIDETHAIVDGRYHIDDLNQHLSLGLPEDDEYDTVAGFVLASLGRVPKQGDSFESHSARFTALKASPTHIQQVGIELLTPVRIAENGK